MLGGDVEESPVVKDALLLSTPAAEPSNADASPTITREAGSSDTLMEAKDSADPAAVESVPESAEPKKEERAAENGSEASVRVTFEPEQRERCGSVNDAQLLVISSNGDSAPVKDEKGHTEDRTGSSSSSQSRRKFRATGLHYPGDEISHPDMVATMLASQNFHLWFEREPNKSQNRKKGGISFTFDDEASARQAYSKIKDLTFNGIKLKFQAPRSFDEYLAQQPAQQQEQQVVLEPSKPEEDDPESCQKIFVEQLVPNADETLIYAVFGKDNLKYVDVRLDNRKTDGSKCAVLTFHDREMAEQAKQEYDEFTVDDGDVSRPMKILLYVDHLKKMEAERQRKIRHRQTAKAEVPARHDVNAPRRSANELKGKAGNLWSAQIVENRGEPVTIKDLGRADLDSHRKHAHSASTTIKEHSGNSEVQCASNANTETSEEKIVSKVAAAAAPPPPPPPPLSEEDSKLDGGQEWPHQRPSSRATGEISAHELSVLIEAAMVRGRVNWAELNTLEELWSLVHHASKDAGWQPELTLKEAMAVVLDRAYRSVEAEWQRDHLAGLIRIWKKELEVDSRSQIRKQLQLAEPAVTSQQQLTGANDGACAANAPGADYTPPPSEKRGKKRSKANKKALMHMMGVGALLADVKKEVAEQEQQDKMSKPTKVNSEQEKRKRKHSASESGEASTTTEDEGEEAETSDWEEGTVSSSGYRRGQQRGKQNEKHLPSKLQSRKKQTHADAKTADSTVSKSSAMPNPEQLTSWTNTMMQSMAGGSNVQQQWMAQAMPMMLQMMPVMAQMMQAQRMMAAAATANVTQAQQQQQMQQQVVQMMQQMMGAASTQSAAPAHPQSHQQSLPAAAANPVTAWTQQQQQHSMNRPVNAAPSLPASGHQQLPYFGRHQQPPPPPPAGPYGSSYIGRSGDQGPMYPVRGNYSSR